MTATHIRLRQATPIDSKLLLRWKNDPGAVVQSFCLRKVTWKEHKVWFATHWNHPDHLLYLAENINSHPVGYIRYARKGDQAECSLCIDPAWRGQGLGISMNRAGIVHCFDRWDVAAIVARIKADNIASRKVFERAGYSHTLAEVYHGVASITLTLFRDEVSKNTNRFLSF